MCLKLVRSLFLCPYFALAGGAAGFLGPVYSVLQAWREITCVIADIMIHATEDNWAFLEWSECYHFQIY